MIKKGQTLVVTTGEYSDYHVLSLCVAERDVSGEDFEALKREYLAVYPKQREPYHFEEEVFFAFLIKHCVLKEVQAPRWGELHLDLYNLDGTKFTDGWCFMPNQGGQDAT